MSIDINEKISKFQETFIPRFLIDRSEQIIKQQQACPNRTMFTVCRDITLKRETKKEKRN
ncbi:hypothetical protein T02_4208 [Trichinella nativa]|uniref:Uncharacterized protein n=1 Tax=Trichinella nativa TaxID=6335 RepID=A0A0V1KMK2_9BILA|nr:hypothetical protein T02_4208 [Trichinella nativa]